MKTERGNERMNEWFQSNQFSALQFFICDLSPLISICYEWVRFIISYFMCQLKETLIRKSSRWRWFFFSHREVVNVIFSLVGRQEIRSCRFDLLTCGHWYCICILSLSLFFIFYSCLNRFWFFSSRRTDQSCFLFVLHESVKEKRRRQSVVWLCRIQISTNGKRRKWKCRDNTGNKKPSNKYEIKYSKSFNNAFSFSSSSSYSPFFFVCLNCRRSFVVFFICVGRNWFYVLFFSVYSFVPGFYDQCLLD